MKKLLSILFLFMATIHVFAVDYLYNQQTVGVDVCWQYDDMCGVLTESNTEIVHWVIDGGSNSCELSAYGWALTPNSQYYAYYPYSQSYNINKNPMTALPVSFAGQAQSENNDAAHLNAYDYMTAQAVSGEDECHFDFSHLGCVLRIECKTKGKQTLKALTISASSNIFATEAIMNVVDGTLTPTAYSSKTTLSLNDITVEEGEHLVVYLMMPPANLNGKLMTITLATTDGMVSSADIKAPDLQAGRIYPMSLKMTGLRKANTRTLVAGSDVDFDSNFDFNHIKAKAPTIISRVTAFAPDFTVDDANCFEQINIIEDDVTAIASQGQSKGQSQYTLSGIKVTTAEKGTIVVNKGKKYLIK